MASEGIDINKELLAKIAAGDEKAFRVLYDAYFNRVSAYVFKLTKLNHATEEIVQDVFTRLWKNGVVLMDIDIPEAYIFSIARNRTIDYLRKLARETKLIAILTSQSGQPEINMEDQLSADSLKGLIEQAMEVLSRQKQEIFYLSKDLGLSHDEIAERLNLSKSTVKNHISETLKHLRLWIMRKRDTELLLFFLFFNF